MNKELMKANANAFKLASDRCLQYKTLTNNSFQILMILAMVNLSFAVELYLKFILLSSLNKSMRTHKLIEIFSSLKEMSRN